jgi:hypothetical protein
MDIDFQPQSGVSAASTAHTLSFADAPPPPPPPPQALPVDLDCIGQVHQAAQQQLMNIDVRFDDSDEDDDDDDDGGDIDSSDEEYNQRNFGIHQALPVDGEPDWSLSE